MPFTLAHPAVVLITPKTKYLHKPALLIGSMSPDFVYFLAGMPTSKVGHTLLGCLWCNLPLSFAVYYLYQYLIRPYFWQHLPKLLSLQPQSYPKPHQNLQSLIVFVISCLIGMATHIGLDAFTHKGSTLVKHSKWLQMMVGNDVFLLPMYKWFQYGGGIIGLTLIGLYLIVMAQQQPYNESRYKIYSINKLKYWGIVSMIGMLFLLIWHMYNPIESNGSGFVVLLVIRLVDVGFIGLFCTGIILFSRRYIVSYLAR